MMSAAPSTTERGPKTTKRTPSARWKPAPLSRAKARTHAAVDKLYAAATEASEGFPRLRAVVEKWISARREEADLDAAYSVLDAEGAKSKADHEALEAACNEWHTKLDAAAEVALSILDLICVDQREADAKVTTFQAMYGDKPEEFRDYATAPMAIIASLRRDIEAMRPAQVDQPAGRETWDAAHTAWRAAEAVVIPDDATDDEGKRICDAAAEAHSTLLRTPAPDLEAVAAKLSFIGEYTRFNAFLDDDRAREILEGDDWTLECIAAAYLDLKRMVAVDQGDGLLLALGAEFERRWLEERTREQQGAEDAEYNALHDDTTRIAAQIKDTPASTIPGLRVKARVALWCQTDNQNEPFELYPPEKVADGSLASSIVNDLLAAPAQAGTPDADCSVLGLIPELRELERQEQFNSDWSGANARALADQIDDLEGRIATTPASSMTGAIYQAALAMRWAELIRGNPEQATRDRCHTVFEQLMTSAFQVFAPWLSEHDWENRIGGTHPVKAEGKCLGDHEGLAA